MYFEIIQMYTVQKGRMIRSNIRHICGLKMAAFLRAVNYSDTQEKIEKEDGGREDGNTLFTLLDRTAI